jgi:PqqD family protein of HPr-rel-A system
LTPEPLAPLRWQAPAAGRIGWRHWDDAYVVFDDATADTHLLSGDAGAVLVALLDAAPSCTTAELLARVSGEATGDDAQLSALHEILAGLERIGLASRVAT